jgi:hypothetical protein
MQPYLAEGTSIRLKNPPTSDSFRKELEKILEPKLLLPTQEQLLSMRDGMLGQMEFARRYTLDLLREVPDALWGVNPPGIPTNFGWQVGHIAMAQYGLMLFRQRGRAEGDLELMPGSTRKRYARGSTPEVHPTQVQPRQELLELLDRIHGQAMAYVAKMPAETLAEPTDMPYAGFPIKLGALLFCPMHESIHAGQIGLLRRAFGLAPVR